MAAVNESRGQGRIWGNGNRTADFMGVFALLDTAFREGERARRSYIKDTAACDKIWRGGVVCVYSSVSSGCKPVELDMRGLTRVRVHTSIVDNRADNHGYHRSLAWGAEDEF